MKRNRFKQPRRPSRPLKLGRLFQILGLVLLLIGLYLYLRDLSRPVVTLSPEQGMLSPKGALVLTVRDAGTGLKSLRVVVRKDAKEFQLFEQSYANVREVTETIKLAQLPSSDGALDIVVTARDHALFPLGGGNRTEQSYHFTVDRQPPSVELLTGMTPVWQGGAATIAYKASEELTRTGVEAGGLFFPGYRQPSGVYLCVVAFPVDATASSYQPKLVAIDQAGNETRTSAGLQLLPRKFPTARIPVSDAFLAAKRDEFHQSVPDTEGIELFLKMNREIRLANRRELTALAAETSATPLFSEPMQRMPRAKATGSYAEARDYFYNNRLVDHQTHLGADLASVAQAPILAANPGKVVFAGNLGIYGGCVVIDHGLGVQTLYGHLSAISTRKGATVTRGEEVGRSGKTGMAGGDHLHFEILVGGVPVRPEEWMERSWIETYILAPMRSR